MDIELSGLATAIGAAEMTHYTAVEIAWLKERLGLRLMAYQDADGAWTIGYGHRKGVKAGDTCTQEQAEKWLEEDLKEERQ
jgi:GH24 family phage-related lysozyme (muramidase)